LLKGSQYYNNLILYIAGGYNPNLPENEEYLEELKNLAKELQISDQVRFWPSIPITDRDHIIRSSLCLLYTPHNEHFGIVPLEAALLETVVIACNSGGPLETIVDGVTGFLREPIPEDWAKVMLELLDSPERAMNMGLEARKRVINLFSQEHFINSLENEMVKLLK